MKDAFVTFFPDNGGDFATFPGQMWPNVPEDGQFVEKYLFSATIFTSMDCFVPFFPTMEGNLLLFRAKCRPMSQEVRQLRRNAADFRGFQANDGANVAQFGSTVARKRAILGR